MLKGITTALFVSMSPNTLGFALGKGQDVALTDLSKTPASDPPLLSFGYDYGRFMSLFSSLDPALGVTSGVAFSFLKWFAVFDVGVRSTGFYMRMSMETGR